MKVLLTLFALMSVMPQAFSEDRLPYRLMQNDSFDFVAPTVSDTTAVADKKVGMIIYDLSSKQYKGLNSLGGWDAMSNGASSLNVSSASAGQERVERLTVATSCTSSPCTITSQSGTWVQSPSGVTRASAGQYSVALTAGEFTAAPACNVTSLAGS
jgi:hypothetical protein